MFKNLETLEIFVISLKHRMDRKKQILDQLNRFTTNRSRINVIEAKYTPSNGAIGCALTHAFTISKFLFETNNQYCLILEDDAEIIDFDRFTEEVEKILTNQSFEWDVILLSSNMAVPVKTTNLTNVFQIVNAQTASAYVISREFAPELIKIFYESAFKLSEYTLLLDNEVVKHLFAIDMIWKSLQNRSKFFAFLPALVRQRESFSDIENKNVNYGV